MNNFSNEFTIAFNAAGKKQSGIGTPLDEEDLDVSITCTAKSWTPQFQDKVFKDCSDQFMATTRVLARWAEMTLEFEATPKLLALWFGFAFGQDSTSGTNPLTHTMNLIRGRDLPLTTLKVGHNTPDGSDTGWIWMDVAVDSISFTASSGFDSTVKVTMTLVGSGNLVAGEEETWPGCYTVTPVALFDASRTLTINSVDYITTTHEITFSFSNDIPREAMFTAGSLDVTKVVRAQDRTYSLTFKIEGIDAPANTLSQLARARSGGGTSVSNSILTIGTANNTFSLKVPVGYFKFNGKPQDYLPTNLGDIAVLNLQIAAQKLTGSAAEPCQVVSVLDTTQQATAFLVAA